MTFLVLYALNMALDGIDGAAARRLNQVCACSSAFRALASALPCCAPAVPTAATHVQISAFGAWLDVIVDNIGRSFLWCRVAPEYGPWISCLEWVTFSCTHTLGSGWKFDFGNAPSWVLRVMANGFYTAVGVWGIAGLHCLPLLIYLQTHMEVFDYLAQKSPATGISSKQMQVTAGVS